MRRALCIVLVLFLLTACVPVEPTPTGIGEYAYVASVVDGDTIELTDGRVVRYIGVNTPETDRPYAREATSYHAALVAGQEIWLETDMQKTDQYGRTLAYAWIEDDDQGSKLVNFALVRQGYANAYTLPPNVRYAEALAQAERDAREQGLGMWAPADVGLQITDLNYDGPGSDQIAPNGEWVEVTNTGDVPVQMTGYTLRDTGRHLYTFGEITLLPGKRIHLYSGRGQDTPSDLYWGLTGEGVWNNEGDTAYLRTPQGLFVDSFAYTP